MPRPGPRPYECVRRAWHSERHQPIRGSLIQEIFRLANEVHDPATLRNKEWLEKLPLVVLKAEEIMYSKANSEAEYMDLNTLWDRTKDSIDTIIRRDDAPETGGDLLQPCIEAALNLGCIPRRASRSQRHNSPVFYLTSVNKDAQRLVSSAAHLLPPLPLPPPNSINHQSSLSRLELWYAAILAANKPNHRRGGEAVNSSLPDGPLGEPTDSNPACGCPSLGRVYPLYYGDDQPKDGMGLLDNAKGALNAGLVFGDASKPATGGECDLSLRLGLFSPPSSESVSSSSCNGSKCSCPSSSGGTRAVNFGTWKAKGFDFICVDSADEPLESFSSKWSSEEEGIATRHGF